VGTESDIKALAYTPYNEVPETVRYEELVKALHYLEQASLGKLYLDDVWLVVALDKWYLRYTCGMQDTCKLNLAALWYALSSGELLTEAPPMGTLLHYIQSIIYVDSKGALAGLYKDGVVMGTVPALNDYDCCNVEHVIAWLKWLMDNITCMVSYDTEYSAHLYQVNYWTTKVVELTEVRRTNRTAPSSQDALVLSPSAVGHDRWGVDSEEAF